MTRPRKDDGPNRMVLAGTGMVGLVLAVLLVAKLVRGGQDTPNSGENLPIEEDPAYSPTDDRFKAIKGA